MVEKNHELYMRRCFDLARLGSGFVSPNPMVGALIRYKNRIIGEGFHQKYGQAHAEVNAINSVAKEDLSLLKHSTLYVSLEPCCVHGNTPPCTDLILKYDIPEVVISCLDSSPGVAGKSLKILQKNGRKTIVGILEKQGLELFQFRQRYVEAHRPYVILKFAQSEDGFMGQEGKQVWISNKFSKRLVHKWRSEVDAIMVGTNTALTDNPKLTNRLFFGNSPLRIAIDFNSNLQREMHLLDDQVETWILSRSLANSELKRTRFLNIPSGEKMLRELFNTLKKHHKSSLLVEGGGHLIKQFISRGCWDEARVLTSPVRLEKGIPAPKVGQEANTSIRIGGDTLKIFYNDGLKKY